MNYLTELRRRASVKLVDWAVDTEALKRERSSKWDDIAELASIYQECLGPWKQQMNVITATGVPIGLQGGLAGLEANPPGANFTTSTIGTTSPGVALYTSGTYAPVPALLNSPKGYFLRLWGQATSAATPGTQSFSAQFGANTVNTTLAGTAITGASNTIAPAASDTATPWIVHGDFILRNTGVTTMVVTGLVEGRFGGSTAGGGSTAPLHFIAQGESASVDNTAASSIAIGSLAATSTTNTMTPHGMLFASWN